MHLCFDRNNPANWFEFLLWHENSNKFIWICVLTKEINLINIYRLLIIFFKICFLTVKIQKIELKFLIWQVKSNEFISMCVLTEKIQQIDLNSYFDMKVQIHLFEFVFWQRKSIWSIITGYLSIFLIKFAFWQEKSSKLIWIFALTRKFKQIYLNFCFDKGNQSDQY